MFFQRGHHILIMQLGSFTTVATLAVLGAVAQASAITFQLGPNAKECFYAYNTKDNANIGYYFAVQSGGAFDVNYHIKAPDGRIIVSEEKQRQGDYVFNANQQGEYEFCFDNEMSTFAEKVIDFQVKDDDAHRAELPPAPKGNEALRGMQETVQSIENKLAGITNTLNYYKTRLNRNQSTVKSTESRILSFSAFDLVLMLAMALFQIAVVKFFFQGSRKQLV